MPADLYDILGVAPDADADAIKAAFRDLAQEYHPDRNPDDPEAEETFKKVLAAFEILSDPDQRRRYDAHGLEAVETNHASTVARGEETASRERGRTASSEGRSGLGDVFTEVFDGRSPFDTSHLRDFGGFQSGFDDGNDVVRSVEVDFLDAVLGRTVELDLDDERVRVPLQPGTETGDRLRLSGRGEAPPTAFGDPGDLVLDVDVRDHPSLSRDGLDLSLDVPIGIHEAILGADIEIPTPHGRVEVSIPKGVASGSKLRLEGLGIRREDERGDFYAVLHMQSPDDVDAAIEEAADTLADGYSRPPRSDLDI